MSGQGNKSATVALVVDGNILVTAYANGSTWGQGANAVTVECGMGQKVHIESKGDMQIFDDDQDYTSFSGWLVQSMEA